MESSNGDDMPDINEEVPPSPSKPPQLFTMKFVSSYGNTELEEIEDNGKPIKFNRKLVGSIKSNSP